MSGRVNECLFSNVMHSISFESLPYDSSKEVFYSYMCKKIRDFLSGFPECTSRKTLLRAFQEVHCKEPFVILLDDIPQDGGNVLYAYCHCVRISCVYVCVKRDCLCCTCLWKRVYMCERMCV